MDQKLYIKPFSILRFQELYDDKEYLQKYLTQESASSWFIEDGIDLNELTRILTGNRIKYYLK